MGTGKPGCKHPLSFLSRTRDNPNSTFFFIYFTGRSVKSLRSSVRYHDSIFSNDIKRVWKRALLRHLLRQRNIATDFPPLAQSFLFRSSAPPHSCKEFKYQGLEFRVSYELLLLSLLPRVDGILRYGGSQKRCWRGPHRHRIGRRRIII